MGAEALLEGLPTVGETIVGKYRIERVLAVGGMGAVMSAHDLALDRRVAIKFMLPKALASPEVRARFFREAKAAVAIRSEHVVDVYEIGTAPPDLPFIVMEFLPGRDLHKLLDSRSLMPVAEAVEYVLQASEALAEAHSLGIVHRDIKPSNLFVTHRPDGTPFVKVVDFGISKTNNALGFDTTSAKSLTQSSVALGSPLYMSPEQVRNSKVVDSRTDIWSLGVVLYELLTKRLPFDGETVPSLAAAIASDPPNPMRTIRPDVPERLEAIVMKCLEKDPTKRYQKISQLARDLQAFAGSDYKIRSYDRIEQPGAVSELAFESTSQHQSPLSEKELQERFGSSGVETIAAATGAATTAGLGTTRRAVKQRRWVGIAGVLGFVLVGGVVAAIGVRMAEQPKPDAASSIAPASASTTIVTTETPPPSAAPITATPTPPASPHVATPPTAPAPSTATAATVRPRVVNKPSGPGKVAPKREPVAPVVPEKPAVQEKPKPALPAAVFEGGR